MIGLGIGRVMSVGSSLALSVRYEELRWLECVWIRTVGMGSYEGWIGVSFRWWSGLAKGTAVFRQDLGWDSL